MPQVNAYLIFSYQIICADTLHFHGGFTYIYKKRMERHTATSSYSGVWKKPLKTNERNSPIPVYDMIRHSWGCVINIQYTTDGTFSYIHRFQYSKFSRLLSKKRIKQICLLLADWPFSFIQSLQSAMQRYKKITENKEVSPIFNSQFNRKSLENRNFCVYKLQKANIRK